MLHLIFDSLSHKPQQQGYKSLLISVACTDSFLVKILLLFESVPDYRQTSLLTIVQDGFRLINVKLSYKSLKERMTNCKKRKNNPLPISIIA